MIDERCDPCVVRSDADKWFVRNEKNGTRVIIPEGFSLNDALIVNKQGAAIASQTNKGRTIGQITDYMVSLFPNADAEQVRKDVYAFLDKLFHAGLVKIKGAEKMYKGNSIGTIEDYVVYRCAEGDLKEINRVLDCGNPFFEDQNVDLVEGIYNPLGVRARVFAYTEEFYVLKDKDGTPCALVSIMHGASVANGMPVLGKVLFVNEIPYLLWVSFVKKILFDFKSGIEQEASRVRVKLDASTESHQVLVQVLLDAGFEQVALLKNELGVNRDAALLDYLY